MIDILIINSALSITHQMNLFWYNLTKNFCTIHNLYNCECITLKQLNITSKFFDNLLNYRRHHQHIYLKEKRTVLYYAIKHL